MKSPATSPTFSVRTNNSARTNDYARSFCPRCDDVMVAPARSQHVKESVIRHWWRCESCGHQFRTSVRLSFICVEAARHAAVA
jgi:RNase P subunit RPR2